MTTLACPAKVNLFLAIHGRDESGYHLIETVMARNYELQDFIHIERAEELSLECPTLAIDGNNTILKAIRVLEKESGRQLKYKMKLEKNIPPGSGLGGGSSNAAAVMLYLNEHEGLGFQHLDLVELGAKVGMDVPFFLSGAQVALATHFGEVITGLPDLPKEIEIKIHLTGIERSTKNAYAEWDKQGKASQSSSESLQKALLQEDPQAILENLHNDFQTIFPLPPLFDSSISEISLLTGSGGAFAVFRVKEMQK